jgi:hypothetical protein
MIGKKSVVLLGHSVMNMNVLEVFKERNQVPDRFAAVACCRFFFH